ncbi:MAG: NAD-dependent epimerase/dehydratase family protein [Gammaproteobacteria bacterium]|nr:NAD-dependent epimerase/dehydratase family protein [Gammaproteobacteria bacterium]
MARILIAGGGYTGARIARLHANDTVWATHRPGNSPAGGDAESGVVLDLDDERASPELPLVDCVYYTVPPDGSDRPDSDHRLARFLALLPGAPLLVYFSTTGVYGDRAGEWVDETATLRPGNDRSRRRVTAEQLVASWGKDTAARTVILRVAGIYGPGRLPLEKVREGRPVLDPGEAGWSNRIHVDDLARAAVACAGQGESGVYNVADGSPSSTAELYDALADLLELPRPARISRQQASQYFSEKALEFMRDSKRVDASKLLGLPGFQLHYPDFRQGLRASLDEADRPD